MEELRGLGFQFNAEAELVDKNGADYYYLIM